ncbi:MAG: hypothetical protein KC592_19925 [Nitrospira sp.]|nr:hypothetical protein [Nitrospira sp.]HNP31165.1 hypothetical protein [Nitrospirales bacterium]
MKIPYLIIVCIVLFVSGAISAGLTETPAKGDEKHIPIADSWIVAGSQMEDETIHRRVRIYRRINTGAATLAEDNTQLSMEFNDTGPSVQSHRHHARRVQLTIFSLCLLSMRPVGHA